MRQKTNMVRKHFYISSEQDISLKQVSQMSGESESTILRLGLDKGIEIINKRFKDIGKEIKNV